MMKLRPKMIEPGKAGWGGLETWIPVVVVVAAVVMHLTEVIAETWAALVVGGALLYTLSEPVVRRSLRAGQFPSWARAAAGTLMLAGVAWVGVAAFFWAVPGEPLVEGDLAAAGAELPIPGADGRKRGWTVEVSTDRLPEKAEPFGLRYRLRIGREEVSGALGKEYRERRFLGGGKKLVDVTRRHHRVRAAIRPGDAIRAASFPADLQGPLRVTLQEEPVPPIALAAISVALLLLGALLEAFEDRTRVERSRLASLVGGLAAAPVYFLHYVTPDNVLMGTLGAAIAALGGAVAGYLAAAVAVKLLRRGA
ncbi:MAG: hypothetical protein QME96_04400 [Myxococcota bacterium]|nr:hypothetical protein [Myxococcota bacterium]